MSVTPSSSVPSQPPAPAVVKAPPENKPSLFLRFLQGIKQVVLCGRGSVARNEPVAKDEPAAKNDPVAGNEKNREPVATKDRVDKVVHDGVVINRIRKERVETPTASTSTTGQSADTVLPNKTIAEPSSREKAGVTSAKNFAGMIMAWKIPVSGVTPEKLADYLRKEAIKIVEGMTKLEGGVHAFKGPHFNHDYRELYEEVIRMGMQIDQLNLMDPDYKEVRLARKEVHAMLNVFAANLNSKVHHDGKYCEDGCVRP